MNGWIFDSPRHFVGASVRASFAKRYIRAVLVLLLLGASACNLPFLGGGQDVKLELEAHAIRLKPGEITYSLTLINHSDSAAGDVTLEAAVPQGGSVLGILGIPRGSQVTQSDSAVTWKIASAPSKSVLGTFSFRVALEDQAQPVQVTARWNRPVQGEATSSIEVIEEAAASKAVVNMPAAPLTEIPGTEMILFSGQRKSFVPIGGPPIQGQGSPLLSEIPGTGIRFFIPLGDRGQVSLSRLEVDPPAEVGQGLTWLANFQATKEHPGSAIFVVPLRQPAPPFSVVHVFADHGVGFYEQAVMGSVTADGLHAAFAADGASDYALAISSEHMQAGTATDFMFRKGALQNVDFTEGVAATAAESLADLDSIMALADTINAMLIGQTEASQPEDSDGDLLSNPDEGSLGTDPFNPDTDGDGLSDGYEVWHSGSNPFSSDSDMDGSSDYDEAANGTDPRDGDSDDDGLSDGYEFTAGTDPNNGDSDGDGATDGQETRAGSDPNNATSTPPPPGGSFAPVPGCGHHTCFSTGSDELYGVGDVLLSDAIQDFLSLQDLALVTPNLPGVPVGQELQGPSGSAALDARDLRAVIVVTRNGILMVIPGGQHVHVVLVQPTLGGTPQPTQASALTEPVELTPGVVTVQPPEPDQPNLTEIPKPPPADTDGPAIKNVSASPNPISAAKPKGCKPTTSTISAGISDPSGVQKAAVIFVGTSAGSVPMSNTGGNQWQAQLGPFNLPGPVNYQIRAFDALGNRSDTQFSTLTVNPCIP